MKADGVIVLGAGLSGLGCARALGSVRVFEAADHPGGHAFSHEAGGAHFDQGGHICHSKDQEWVELISRAVGDVVQIPQSRVANYWRGRWITYPVQNHLNELPLGHRLAALRDFVLARARRGAPRNYHEWCLSHYGNYLTANFYAEYTRKYWRVPMEELATDWLAGRLLPSQVRRILAGAFVVQDETQSTFARFLYPARGGFFSFVRSLYDGLDITYRTRAERVDLRRKEVHFGDGRKERYEALASSIPLPELVGMIPDAPPAVREAAGALRNLQLLCVNVIVSRAALTPYHWFYVYDSDIDISRVSVISNLAPGSVPEGRSAVQVEVFRRRDEAMDVEGLAAKAVRDIGRVLGFDPERDIVVTAPVHVPHAYVISDLRRAAAVETIQAWLRAERIYSMGLFGGWKFVWSDVAFRSGEKTARDILSAT